MKKVPLALSLLFALMLAACAPPPAPTLAPVAQEPVQSLIGLLERTDVWMFKFEDCHPLGRECVVVAEAPGWTVEGYGRGLVPLREEQWVFYSQKEQFSFSGGKCGARCRQLDRVTALKLETAMARFVRNHGSVPLVE